ncbi:hypothetical protein [Streptomyces sp. NPDC020917]|uniref:hypothetical protein n=1 Tax=Streptomyces sp. NPDC020917 TaxID=3365102 RepID=UPI003795E6A1
MVGVEIAVGYVFAWAVRKARRVGGRADAEVDQVVDAAMERLHALVARRLGPDASLTRVEEEAAAGGELTPRTRQRLELALEDAVERDAVFAEALNQAVEEVRAAAGPGGVSAGDGGLAVGGDLDIRADHGSAAAVRMGDVRLGNPPVPGPLTQG